MGFLEIAILIGISPLDFWELTPFEIELMVKAYANKREEESKEKITLAYMNAMWTIQWLGKKKPEKLDKILNGSKPKEPMSNEQMLNKVKELNAMFGGEVK